MNTPAQIIIAFWLLGSVRLWFRWFSDKYDSPEGWMIPLAILLGLIIGPMGLIL